MVGGAYRGTTRSLLFFSSKTRLLVTCFRLSPPQEWGNGVLFDASDKDGKINLQDWPTVKGMYMPDAITTFKAGGARCEYQPPNTQGGVLR